MPEVDTQLRRKLIEALAETPIRWASRSQLDALLRSAGLPSRLVGSIPRSDQPLPDLRNAVYTANAWSKLEETGEPALKALIMAVLPYVSGTDSEPKLQALLAELTASEAPPGLSLRQVLRGHQEIITRLAWSPDGMLLASGSKDRSVKLWDTDSGQLRQTLCEQTQQVNSVVWSPDGRMLASASKDRTVCVWDASSGHLLRVLMGHMDQVNDVSWALDGKTIASASHDGTIRLWSPDTGRETGRLKGHTEAVTAITWMPGNSRLAASASWDKSVILWDTRSLKRVARLCGHTDLVNCLSFAPDGRLASGADDRTIRIWNADEHELLATLEGHSGHIESLAFSADGRFLASQDDHTVRIWRTDSWATVALFEAGGNEFNFLPGLAYHPSKQILATLGERDTAIRIWDVDTNLLLGIGARSDTVSYYNIKMVLIGSSGVGKSALGTRISQGGFRPTESTHGALAWNISIPREVLSRIPELQNAHVDLTVVELGGPSEYQLISALVMKNADIVLLLIDDTDSLTTNRGLSYWAEVLKKEAPPGSLKYLVASRCDRGSPVSDRREINQFAGGYQLDDYFRTSALTGEGVDQLLDSILRSIPWAQKPRGVMSPTLQIIHDFLGQRREAGGVFISRDQLWREIRDRSIMQPITTAEVEAGIDMLQARGHVMRLGPRRELILLQPQLILQYAAALVGEAHRDSSAEVKIPQTRGLACLEGGSPLTSYSEEMAIWEEATIALFQSNLCLRRVSRLVFPSEATGKPSSEFLRGQSPDVTYRFTGNTKAIYASLVVRLGYSGYFELGTMWKNGCAFMLHSCDVRIIMRNTEPGVAELDVYSERGTDPADLAILIRFISDHLHTRGSNTEERIRLFCPNCRKPVQDQGAIAARIRESRIYIFCQYCDAQIPLPQITQDRLHSIPPDLVRTIEERMAQEMRALRACYRKEQNP